MIIELSIGKSRYKISCAESEKEKLLNLAEKLNQRVNQLSLSLKHADDKTLLAVSALMIEEELAQRGEVTEQKIEEPEEEEEGGALNNQDLFDAVSENMENVADYIEKLTKKIQDY